MLATDELLDVNNYSFKSSPGSSSDDSFVIDYDLPSDEDFLQQLSADLDIPLFLNQDKDEMSLFNSILDKSADEIMSEITSSTRSPEQLDFGDFQKLDPTNWDPEVKVKTEIKTEEVQIADECCSTDSSNSDSPSAHNCKINVPAQTRRVPKVARNSKVTKRNAIYPKAPYTIPTSKSANKILVMPLNNFNPAPDLNNIITPDAVKTEVVLMDDTVVPITTTAAIPTFSPEPVTTISPVTISSIPMIIKSEKGAAGSVVDLKAFKRQQRMIKNRESACLSRKKKKDYVTQLERDVQNLKAENLQLKMENAALKQQLAARGGGSTVKTVTNSVALCALLLMVAVNFNFIRYPYSSSIAVTNMQPAEMKKMNDHHGRNLLWDLETSDTDNKTTNNLPICPMPVNQTENVRLALELHRWIGKPFNASLDTTTDNLPVKSPKLRAKHSKLTKRNQNSLDSPVLSSVYRMGRRNRKYIQEITNNEIQVFSPSPEQIYSEFFEAINRQDDTFYVVSFSAHHMLLPALNHNKTRRPKMSLIMPSLLPNETASSRTSVVPLMQIDCEVLDTRLIHVKYGAIPQHLRTEGNTTRAQENKQSDDAIQKQHYKNDTQYVPYFVRNNHSYNSSMYEGTGDNNNDVDVTFT